MHFRAKNQQLNFNAIFQIQKYFGVKIQIFEQYFLAGKFEILQKLLLAKKLFCYSQCANGTKKIEAVQQ